MQVPEVVFQPILLSKGYREAKRFLDLPAQSRRVDRLFITESLEQQARETLARFADHAFSFVGRSASPAPSRSAPCRVYGRGSSRFSHNPGGTPAARLNARLKAASELYPTRAATSGMVNRFSWSICLARCIRQAVK